MRVAAATVLALLAFAANSVLCRVALAGGNIDAVSFSVIRFAGGAAFLLFLGSWRGPRVSLAGGWGSAFFLFLYGMPFAVAYTRLSAGTGALILFGSVQVTMMMTALRGGERPSAWQWLGFGSALAGLCYLVAPGLASPPLSAAALMMLAGVSWGTYTLRGRTSTNPLADTTRSFVKVVPLVLIVSLLAVRQLHADRVGVLLALASGVVASGLGYAVWYSVLGRLTTTRAAVAQLAVPILAAAGGVVLLNERLTFRLAVSGGFVLGGVALVVFSRERRVSRSRR